MRYAALSAAALALAAAHGVSAQTYTTCNPLNESESIFEMPLSASCSC
jgi:hypothetical protein